jgi:hypothetical protein
MAKLKNVQYFILTTDIWIDIQTRSYISVTVHFVDQYKFNAALLGAYELNEKHTSEYIATQLVDVCTEWNITKQKIVAVVSDGAANMIKAINLFCGKKTTHSLLSTYTKSCCTECNFKCLQTDKINFLGEKYC